MTVGGSVSSVFAVVAMTLALGVCFPRAALTFKAKDAGSSSVAASFVFLDGNAEAEVLRLVRDTWKKSGGAGRLYADLVFSDLPPMPKCEVLSVETRIRPPAFSVVETGVGPYLPSCRASDPVTLPPEPVRQQLPFPREELLRIK